MNLLPEERETHISMAGDNHDDWIVFSDDPYWMRRLDRIADGKPVGEGKEYRLRADQILVRRGKPQLSDAARAERSARARRTFKNAHGVREIETPNVKPV